MVKMRSYCLCWLLLVISTHHVLCEEPLPIMELYGFVPDPIDIVKKSDCKDGLINDIDYFTVRGKVHKNGSNPEAYEDRNLYLYAVEDPSTNIWAAQCQPDLSVCRSDLKTECHCEYKDVDGYYHLVMTIMAKSIYSGGKLMLSWNDDDSSFYPPVTSNTVDYFPGTISDQKKVTLKAGTNEMILDTDPSFIEYTKFRLEYTPDMTSVHFCVENVRPNSLIDIQENKNIAVQTTTDSCVTFDFTDQSPDRVLNMSFTETGGCERKGSYVLRLKHKRTYFQKLIWEYIFPLCSIILIKIVAVYDRYYDRQEVNTTACIVIRDCFLLACWMCLVLALYHIFITKYMKESIPLPEYAFAVLLVFVIAMFCLYIIGHVHEDYKKDSIMIKDSLIWALWVIIVQVLYYIFADDFACERAFVEMTLIVILCSMIPAGAVFLVIVLYHKYNNRF